MQETNSVEFWIPMLPISVNQACTIDPRRKTLVLTRKAWEKKGYLSMFCKTINVTKKPILRLEYEYHGNWFYKNGSVRKVDGPNFDKMLIDVVCEKLGIDDAYVFEWRGSKIIGSEKEGVAVRVTAIKELIDENGGRGTKSSKGSTDGSEKDYGPSWNKTNQP